MTLAELRDATRTVLDDRVAPYLWPDADIDRRLNNAVREACMRARLLRDDAGTNPALCQIGVSPGQTNVTLDASVLAIRAASVAGRPPALQLMATTDMDALEPGWDSVVSDPAQPVYLIVDGGEHTARLWPAPDTALTLQLRVWRVPTDAEQMATDSDEPVVALPDAEELTHWAAFECYMVKDADTWDPKAAQDHLAIFEARFGRRPSLHEMRRWADTPPRVRRACFF